MLLTGSFKGKKIAVHIYEDEMDETEYLMSDPIARQRLLESIENVKKGKNMKVYTVDELNEMFLKEPVSSNLVGIHSTI